MTRSESVFILLNFLDAITTAVFTALGSWDMEGNPMLRWVGMRYGCWALVLKMILAIAVPALLRWFFSIDARARLLYATNWALGAIVIWNVVHVIGGGR